MPASVCLSFIRVILCLTAVLAVSGDDVISPSNYTAPGAFPTSVYAQYYNSPTATSAQVQPVISDPVTHEMFPLWLTDPNNIPQNDTTDPHPLPPKASSSKILQQAIAQIQSIAKNPTFGNNTCARCQASLEIAKFVALAAPEEGSELAVQLCELFSYSSTCANTYSRLAIGNILTQVASLADVGGHDGQLLCYEFLGLCPLPPTSPLNLTGWFAKPKPNPLPPPKQPSGNRLKVLHISDFHIDARYATGAEANCTLGQCCRANAFNTQSPDSPLFPAPRFGAYSCDAPYALILSVLQAIPVVAGTEETGFAFTLFTGDMLTRDSDNQKSRAFTEYSEVVLYDLFKRLLGPGPVYATLGNHDSYNDDLAAPYTLEGELGKQFDWLYDHVSALWKHQHWLPEASIEMARLHYSAYMVKRADGLRVISLNTNLWYSANYFNYINSSQPDTSGILRFLTDELQDAEDAGDRVWIMGHVLSGWDGTNALLNPSNLSIHRVDRFSPHVIANIFWGHSHEDQMSIGPSVTPMTNLNSGFRVYEVDSSTFEILDAHTWQSSVNDYPSLDSQLEYGPTYSYEYNTRKTYGGNITWGDHDPLNATWWHMVTEQMEISSSLVQTFNTYQGKSSILTPPCTGDCIPAKICYIRSGSASIAQENCIQGYGSVQ
ncbi:Metallo-dependent phosphatase-like protein [Hygrophoropsis aurantiaca]|uniref:Metallo-dependent phosphatase-like protein n=1 Tax=Hygrophoropsis aurantiaca TaxID=72124 RepID=A0ACB7ZUM2_9AGAM|nr:Metallo-dependent phosphatase-like protein [Hygrophoropsis aurantiaca]